MKNIRSLIGCWQDEFLKWQKRFSKNLNLLIREMKLSLKYNYLKWTLDCLIVYPLLYLYFYIPVQLNKSYLSCLNPYLGILKSYVKSTFTINKSGIYIIEVMVMVWVLCLVAYIF